MTDHLVLCRTYIVHRKQLFEESFELLLLLIFSGTLQLLVIISRDYQVELEAF